MCYEREQPLQVSITISTSNDAFMADPTHEVCRILANTIIRWEGCSMVSHLLRDHNGNQVGHAIIQTTKAGG